MRSAQISLFLVRIYVAMLHRRILSPYFKVAVIGLAHLLGFVARFGLGPTVGNTSLDVLIGIIMVGLAGGIMTIRHAKAPWDWFGQTQFTPKGLCSFRAISKFGLTHLCFRYLEPISKMSVRTKIEG